MWVYEEMIEGRKLTEIINQDHENVKYLPGVKLPENVVAVPDLVEGIVYYCPLEQKYKITVETVRHTATTDNLPTLKNKYFIDPDKKNP